MQATFEERPLIGVTCDVVRPDQGSGRPRVVLPMTYAEAVAAAGGVPVALIPIVELIPHYLRVCRGFVLTGGDDPEMEPFGRATLPKAKRVDPSRQAFETALLRALDGATEAPVLGVCLGMQMMALSAGGDLDQHLPDTLPTADRHHPGVGSTSTGTGADPPGGPSPDRTHEVIIDRVGLPAWAAFLPDRGTVASHHRQAVSHPGRLRVLARASDGVIEAIGDAGTSFRLGVQWHPERTSDAGLGSGVFRALIRAARAER